MLILACFGLLGCLFVSNSCLFWTTDFCIEGGYYSSSMSWRQACGWSLGLCQRVIVHFAEVVLLVVGRRHSQFGCIRVCLSLGFFGPWWNLSIWCGVYMGVERLYCKQNNHKQIKSPKESYHLNPMASAIYFYTCFQAGIYICLT